jgi:septum formation protein
VIVLASGSATRRVMLEQAGVDFVVDTAPVDEAGIKQAMAGETNDPATVALALAEVKALRVSPRHPGKLIIGADQMLDCDGRWYDKPEDPAAARAQLAALRGRRHRLNSAVVAVRDGQVVWRHVQAAHLTMRAFSDDFLDEYLAAVGPAVLASVGAYHLEGRGAQLFSAVDGDHFTILGLPLLQVMQVLRDNGELRV